MAVKVEQWDAARFLRDEADIAAYLETCAEEAGDDPAFMLQALGAVARARSMSALARETGLTRAALYQALSATGNPTFATVTKVAAGLGIRIQFATLRSTSQPARQRPRTSTSASARSSQARRPRKPRAAGAVEPM
ncbi:MAG: putative addiction module antidote protein [Acidobacteria bacterium]|nr:putative addiction module antidote protein [Acidobacteriota bacterium]